MTEDERRTKRLLIHCFKKLDDAYEHYRQEGTKSLLAKDLADIVGSILFIGETEHLDLETEVLACIERRTRQLG